uniref:Protein S100-A1 n=1 Tax=Salvator merianae TaxID=96440 RepID=A0A8D0DFS3_SALMN
PGCCWKTERTTNPLCSTHVSSAPASLQRQNKQAPVCLSKSPRPFHWSLRLGRFRGAWGGRTPALRLLDKELKHACSPPAPRPAACHTLSRRLLSLVTSVGLLPSAAMTELENAMAGLISVFHNYSGKEGDKHKLNKKELKELLQSELAGFLENQKDSEAVEKIMHDLDEDGDGEVDFQEFVVLVAALTVACNEFFCEDT